jgi:phenylacetate-CoA ligase
MREFYAGGANYHQRYPLPARCRNGTLDGCDMVAVSSGSSGRPTVRPRSVLDERAVAARFEQVFTAFEAETRSTLAVICFALGSWVGGMYTTACARHLAAKGYPITVVTPGNNIDEILRVVGELSPLFEQTVLLGYPPFVKPSPATAGCRSCATSPWRSSFCPACPRRRPWPTRPPSRSAPS